MPRKPRCWVEYQGKALALAPKCGSTSFSARAGNPRITNDEAVNLETRVMFIREPIDRFVSAYSFFYALNSDDPFRDNVPRSVTHHGYEYFVDHALATPNPHWAPQMDLTGGIANRLHKFDCESIRKWWPTYWAGRLPDWINACSHLPVSDYRADDIRRYYAEDIAAYERAI